MKWLTFGQTKHIYTPHTPACHASLSYSWPWKHSGSLTDSKPPVAKENTQTDNIFKICFLCGTVSQLYPCGLVTCFLTWCRVPANLWFFLRWSCAVDNIWKMQELTNWLTFNTMDGCVTGCLIFLDFRLRFFRWMLTTLSLAGRPRPSRSMVLARSAPKSTTCSTATSQSSLRYSDIPIKWSPFQRWAKRPALEICLKSDFGCVADCTRFSQTIMES